MNGLTWVVQRSGQWMLLSFAAVNPSAASLEPGDKPMVLSPAYPEIPPGFWEQYWGWMLVGGILLAGVITLAVWWKFRRIPPAVIPIEVQVRGELEALMQQGENGAVLSRISRALRRYVVTAFVFPQEEMTTNELVHRLQASGRIGPELAPKFVAFFRACDAAKFSPETAAAGNYAGRALGLLEETERRRMLLRQAADKKPPVYR